MAHFLLEGAYTPETWKTLVNNPQDRSEAVRPVIEKLGGKVENVWFSFGDYDVVLIMQMPDNVSAAAFSLAVASGGVFRSLRTTPLLTIAEGMEAMKKASGAGYQPPR